MTEEKGGRLGLTLRNDDISATGTTDRIRHLNRMLHAHRPSLELHRARVFTKHFKEHEGESFIKRRYEAMAKVYATMPTVIYDDERLIGWQGEKIRSCSVCPECQSHWLADDLKDLATRDYDPWQSTEEEREELLRDIIPYWKKKTLWYKWSKQTPNVNLASSGYVDGSNFVGNPGAHYQADMEHMLHTGVKAIYDRCLELRDSLDYTLPENVGKKEFYDSLREVCLGIKTYGEKMCDAAYTKAEESDPERAAELREAGNRVKKICWEKPETFVECLHMMWLMCIFTNTETPAPACCGMGRVDQYLWPYLKKDLEEGKITIDEAFEYVQEYCIKCTNIVWFMPENLTILFGGYYRWTGSYAVGGVDENGQDAVNPVSYIFLRASRVTRTTAPSVHINLSSKNPDSFLYEGVKLCAAGTGQPAFFDVDVLHNTMLHKNAGNDAVNNISLKDLRKKTCTFGCQDLGLVGETYGHADSCIINLGNCISLAMNRGVLPEGCPGYGAGEKIGVDMGDPRDFKDFEEFYKAVIEQFNNAVDIGIEHLLLADKIQTEEYQMPVQTMLSSYAVEEGRDIASGVARIKQGPCFAIIGVADFTDSLCVIKKLVYEEKKITMDELCKAVAANFEGYEEIRKMCIDAPKWGNDDDYVDSILARAAQDLTSYAQSKKNYRGGYCDLSVQNNQVQVPAGAQCWALPNGRLALTPFADTLSAEQNKDTHGPLAAINSYAKIDHASFANGTILNMWISKSEVVEEGF